MSRAITSLSHGFVLGHLFKTKKDSLESFSITKTFMLN